MAGFAGGNEFYTTNPNSQYNFEMPSFGQEQLNFQNFDSLNPQHLHQQQQQQQQHAPQQQQFSSAPPMPQNYDMNYTNTSTTPLGGFYDPNAYAGNVYGSSKPYGTGSGEGDSDSEDEIPLLEELGINPNHILQKTLAVLNPTRGADQLILQDTDMAGPLAFCLALGGFLLLSGKVTFSYIYGIGVVGCTTFYFLLSLMAAQSNVTYGAVASVLGYCILPMVLLSGLNIIISMEGTLGLVVTGICILWCSLSASKLFVTAYSMDHQQLLIIYPCALLYGVFALITIF